MKCAGTSWLIGSIDLSLWTTRTGRIDIIGFKVIFVVSPLCDMTALSVSHGGDTAPVIRFGS